MLCFQVVYADVILSDLFMYENVTGWNMTPPAADFTRWLILKQTTIQGDFQYYTVIWIRDTSNFYIHKSTEYDLYQTNGDGFYAQMTDFGQPTGWQSSVAYYYKGSNWIGWLTDAGYPRSKIVRAGQAILDGDNGNQEIPFSQSYQYPYEMKIKDETGAIKEYAFTNKPVYYGAGANWMIVSAEGTYKENGEEKETSGMYVKIQNMISTNFNLEDSQGNYVVGAPEGTKIRRISGVTPSDIWLDATYAKVQWYLTSHTTPIITYNNQDSITNTQKGEFDILDGFAVIRIQDPGTWNVATNAWYITDVPVAPPPPVELGDTPERENYPEGLEGDISFGIDKLLYYVKWPFVTLGAIITDLITEIGKATEYVGKLTPVFQKVYEFFPAEYVNAGMLCILLGVFSLIIGLKR